MTKQRGYHPPIRQLDPQLSSKVRSLKSEKDEVKVASSVNEDILILEASLLQVRSPHPRTFLNTPSTHQVY
jgi:hypothetical protein